MRSVEPEQILEELAEIAFAAPGEEGGLPVKMADKLKALEILYKFLEAGRGMAAPVTIIDDVAGGPDAAPERGEQTPSTSG